MFIDELDSIYKHQLQLYNKHLHDEWFLKHLIVFLNVN